MKRVRVLLLFTLLAFLAGCAGFQKFSSKEFGFSFEYPSEWTDIRTKDHSGILLVSYDKSSWLSIERITSLTVMSKFFEISDPGIGNSETNLDLLYEGFLSADSGKAKVPEARLGKAGADSGVDSIHKVFIKDTVRLIRFVLFKKGSTFYKIETSMLEKDKDQYAPVYGSIIDSFTIIQ